MGKFTLYALILIIAPFCSLSAQSPDFFIQNLTGLEYRSVPIGQNYPLQVGIVAGNKGSVRGRSMNLILSIRKAGTVVYQESFTKDSLEPGTNFSFLTARFRPSKTGLGAYSLDISGSFAEPDANPADNQFFLDTLIIVTDSVFARENGKIIANAGFNESASYGMLFRLYERDTLSSLAFILDDPIIGTEVTASVYEFNGVYPTKKVASSATFTIHGKGRNMIPFKKPVPLQAAQYIIAVDQLGSKNLSLGVSDTFYTENTSFYRLTSNMLWKPFDKSFPYSLMIRPHFMRDYIPASTAINSYIEDSFNIYPNPCLNRVMFEWPGTGKPALICINDHLGREILKKNLEPEMAEIDMSGFPPGIYFLSVMDDEKMFSRSLLKLPE